MNDDIAIKVDGVSKSFRLPHEKSGSIKGALVGWRQRKRGYENQHVLKDVSFEIKKGEFFGIVGRNGSGKSTLLKLISQIYNPDKGSITVNGKLTPFIELGVGFNPELSGRDNVYLNGALLGFSRGEMEAMYDEIVEFAELERFMDQKLKNYSSGMQVRLAFSIAIRANTDILVLDEVLAVGDEAFQRKCFKYFADLKKQKKTVILVTHDMNSVQQHCTRAMLLERGKVEIIGSPAKVANSYSLSNMRGGDGSSDTAAPLGEDIVIDKVRTFSASGKTTKQFSSEETITVQVDYTLKSKQEFTTGISLRQLDDTLLAGVGSQADTGLVTLPAGSYSSTCVVPAKSLRKGTYTINTSFWSEDRHLLACLDVTMSADTPPEIAIIDDVPSRSGMFNLDAKWQKPVNRK